MAPRSHVFAWRSGASMYYTYILYSKSKDRHYVGYSTDLRKRLADHLQNRVATTRGVNDYKIVWYAGFTSKSKAIEFEKYLKSSSGYAFRKKRFF